MEEWERTDGQTTGGRRKSICCGGAVVGDGGGVFVFVVTLLWFVCPRTQNWTREGWGEGREREREREREAPPAKTFSIIFFSMFRSDSCCQQSHYYTRNSSSTCRTTKQQQQQPVPDGIRRNLGQKQNRGSAASHTHDEYLLLFPQRVCVLLAIA